MDKVMEPVTAKGDYRSPDRTPGALARRWPSLAFHWKMLGIYLRSNRFAVKGLMDGDRWARCSMEILRALESVGVRVSTSGLDVLRELDHPVIIVGNHMSTLETMVLPCLLQPFLPITFIVKESLTRFPVFGPILKARNPVRVGRVDPRADLKTVMEEGADRVARGISIVVFPQTTRSARFEPEKFNSIGVKLARRVGVQVVPVALKTDAWGIGKPVRDFGPIHPERPVMIAFGEPLTVTGGGRDEHQEIVSFIQGKLEEWERSER